MAETTGARRLSEVEGELEPMSADCRAILDRIRELDCCHEHYLGNVQSVLQMIGMMVPGRILGCGEACESRMSVARAFARALRAWEILDGLPDSPDEVTLDVYARLCEKTRRKSELVGHLIAKIEDDSYPVYTDGEKNPDSVESRIQDLAICHHRWAENLTILLTEIGSETRQADWEDPDRFSAHGSCPDRIGSLEPMLAAASAWVEGQTHADERWSRVLGTPTPEKRWLVASLCFEVAAHQEAYGGVVRLPQPDL